VIKTFYFFSIYEE